jgi:hypothetical protein
MGCLSTVRRHRLKQRLVTALGGVCSECKLAWPYTAYDFHHTGGKTVEIANAIANCNLATVWKELKCCVLMCATCHRITHSRNDAVFQTAVLDYRFADE